MKEEPRIVESAVELEWSDDEGIVGVGDHGHDFDPLAIVMGGAMGPPPLPVLPSPMPQVRPKAMAKSQVAKGDASAPSQGWRPSASQPSVLPAPTSPHSTLHSSGAKMAAVPSMTSPCKAVGVSPFPGPQMSPAAGGPLNKKTSVRAGCPICGKIYATMPKHSPYCYTHKQSVESARLQAKNESEAALEMFVSKDPP